MLTTLLALSTVLLSVLSSFFFFNDTATTEIYTLSLHDALPILSRASWRRSLSRSRAFELTVPRYSSREGRREDRKSTRLNSSHLGISYAVFCLKKKKIKTKKWIKNKHKKQKTEKDYDTIEADNA